MIVRCLILDDEPPAQRLLKKYIDEVAFLELHGICGDSMEALDILSKMEIDLIFLDIQMPKMSGIQFLRSLHSPPKVVITTAYPNYAAEGFELSVTDYLVKPFSFERFLNAVLKVQQILKNELSNRAGKSKEKVLVVKADKKYYRVPVGEIEYLQAYGDYVKIYRKEGSVLLTKDTLTNLETSLGENQFVRIHRSYVISLDSIRFMEGNRIKIGDAMLPISANYREDLLKHLQKNE